MDAEIILVFFTAKNQIECIIRFGFGAKGKAKVTMMWSSPITEVKLGVVEAKLNLTSAVLGGRFQPMLHSISLGYTYAVGYMSWRFVSQSLKRHRNAGLLAYQFSRLHDSYERHLGKRHKVLCTPN